MDWQLIFGGIATLAIIVTGVTALMRGGFYAGQIVTRLDDLVKDLKAFTKSNEDAHDKIHEKIERVDEKVGKLENR